MAKKKANTPKPAKSPGKAAKTAAGADAKNRKRVTRDDTNSREEVRRVKKPGQGPK
jgi:hypothetical protein